MPNRFAPVVACIAWLAATAALAQAAAPGQASARAGGPRTTVAPVTVRAPPLPPSEAQRRSEAFVGAYAAPTAAIDQYARWHDPVCVTVAGVAPEEAAIIASRVEAVARAVGLKVGGSGCRPDIQILFSDQPQALLDKMAKRNEWILGYHYPSQTTSLKTVTRPVQSWYVTASLGGAANNVELEFSIVDAVHGGNGPNANIGTQGIANSSPTKVSGVDAPGVRPPNGCANNHFSTCRLSVFANVMVVVDSRRLQGKTLGPVSDYLAMLALSQPRSLDGCLGLPSVIDLFAPTPCPGRAPPTGLTRADAAYLAALYASDAEANRAGEQSEIAERMAKILVDPAPMVLTALDGAGASSPGGSGR